LFLKRAIKSPLLKMFGLAKEDIQNYRPISNLSSISKHL